MSEIECPSCGRDDQVQSVSAIVQGGTSTTQYQGNGYGIGFVGNSTALMVNQTSTVGTTQTALARSLNPPPRPSVEGVGGRVIFGIILGIFGASALMQGLVGLNEGIPSSESFIIACVLFGLAVLIWMWAWASHDASVKECRREMPTWERAASVWLHIFYCGRCGTIHLPALPKTYPTDTSVSALTGIFKDAEDLLQQRKESQDR